jgi:hypothetical protein
MALNQQEQQQIDTCVERFRGFVQDKIDPPTLFKLMDEILFNYAYSAARLSEESGPTKGEADRLCLLKDLRDLFNDESGG